MDNFFDTFIRPKESIGVIIACMDRSDNLNISVSACLSNNHINEIIILDYGSTIPITNFTDERVKVYRIETNHWHLTKAYNIAAQLCSCDILVKLDADYVISLDFFESHYVSHNEYITGFSKKDSLCGFLMIHKHNFMKINGYNERIVTYGYDDDDINYRLQSFGLIPKNLDRSKIKHLPHNKNPEIWFKNNQNPNISRKESIYKNTKISKQNPWTNKDKMSQYYSHKISAFVCCMNRQKNLLKSLKSWIDTKYFNEIVVLDYGSEPKLVIDTDDPIVKLYRESAKLWHLTKAYNIASQLTNADIIVKLDSDYLLHPEFFQHNSLHDENMFLTGNGCSTQSLWGFLMLYKKKFLSVNGYNERIVGWGHDDVDINNRLKNIGLKSKTINSKFISHIPHFDNKNQYTGLTTNTQQSRQKNIQIINQYPWTIYDHMSTLSPDSAG